MRTFGRALAALVAFAGLTQLVPTVAADTQLQALETAKQDVAAAARQERRRRVFGKGGPEWVTTSKGRQLQGLEGDLDRLIDELEEGKAVNPAEIDRALRRAESLR
jgi:hypothetical protein